jgi:TatD DNase family protein
MFVDTHCHLDADALCDRGPLMLQRAEAAGVTRFIVPGVAPSCWDKIMALAAHDSRVFAAPGIHPMAALECTEEAIDRLEAMARHAVAIGEIGLDYSYTQVPRQIQQTVFRVQIRLAVRLGLPVIIHCRRAFADLLFILRQEQVSSVGGVMHAFSGSLESAAECIKLGLRIGIAGPVTYATALRPVEVVRRIPLEQLLLETDAPDLAPVPHRGTICEPAFLLDTARRVAFVKDVSLDQVATVTTATAQQMFGFDRKLLQLNSTELVTPTM